MALSSIWLPIFCKIPSALSRSDWIYRKSGTLSYRQVVKNRFYPRPVLERVAYTPFSLIEKARYAQGSLSTEGLVLPDFLGIGAMKGGTTWLWGQLSAHPQINIPMEKELHYFCWDWHRSLKYYSEYFAKGAGPGKVNGEITVEYAYLPIERIQFIQKMMPDLKLLMMMRNPIDRAWSHAKQELIFRTNRNYEEVREFEFIRRFQGADSRRLGDYVGTIDRWTSVFPKERLWVGFYDDVTRCPQKLLTGLFQHLGVSTDIDWETMPLEEHYIPGPPAPPMPPKYREILQDIYADQIEELYQRYGEPVAKWRCK